MPENNPPQGEKPAVLIEPLDTTKEGIRAYLDDAAKDRKSGIETGKVMKLAVFRFIVDSAKITDSEMRKQLWKQFDATPTWFGCNASQARQVFGIKSALEAYMEEIQP